MILYYGADKQITQPIKGYGNSNNDYGLGFYLTKDEKIAKLWASKFLDGYCIKYDLDITNLNVCYLNSVNEQDVLRWLSILVKNRFSKEEYGKNKENIDWLIENYPFNEDAYDVIVGYRADDSYFQYSRDFIANELSLQSLMKAMKLGKIGSQYVLKSAKAFSSIKYLSVEKVEHSDEYSIFRNKALQEYRLLQKEDSINDTFIRDLRRGNNVRNI